VSSSWLSTIPPPLLLTTWSRGEAARIHLMNQCWALLSELRNGPRCHGKRPLHLHKCITIWLQQILARQCAACLCFLRQCRVNSRPFMHLKRLLCLDGTMRINPLRLDQQNQRTIRARRPPSSTAATEHHGRDHRGCATCSTSLLRTLVWTTKSTYVQVQLHTITTINILNTKLKSHK
jgi:hypothetical protein